MEGDFPSAVVEKSHRLSVSNLYCTEFHIGGGGGGACMKPCCIHIHESGGNMHVCVFRCVLT